MRAIEFTWFIGALHWRTPKRSSRAHLVTLILSITNMTNRPADAIVSSKQPFMGDNYCDAINNRAFCNYDGGDCCQSTAKTKKVSGTFSPRSLATAHPSGTAIFEPPPMQ